MTSMNVSLPEELKAYVETQTRRGYSTPSEYVRELIREDQKRRAGEKLDSLLLDGLNSGDSLPVDAEFWTNLKREALAKLEARRKTKAKKSSRLLPSGLERGSICWNSSSTSASKTAWNQRSATLLPLMRPASG
jgi:antitoxin ParD1/3/4